MEQVLEAFGLADQFERSGHTLTSAYPLPTRPAPPEALREGHQRNREQ
jgi:hypothetical protein